MAKKDRFLTEIREKWSKMSFFDLDNDEKCVFLWKRVLIGAF
jgi:hypothetical protein